MNTRDVVFEYLVEKPWLAQDEAIIITTPFDPYWDQFLWTSETYFSHGQVQLVINDDDVTICDIEAEGDTPMIWLELANPDEWEDGAIPDSEW